jgi:hypothetical protein
MLVTAYQYAENGSMDSKGTFNMTRQAHHTGGIGRAAGGFSNARKAPKGSKTAPRGTSMRDG